MNGIPNGGPKRLRNNTEFIFHFVKDQKHLKFYMDRVLKEPAEETKNRAKYQWSVTNHGETKDGKRTNKKSIDYALVTAELAVEKYLAANKSVEITKKKPAQMVDSPKAAVGGGNDTATLSWNQLKREEIDVYEELFEHAGMSKKDYLKAVADQRKGA